MNGSNVLCSFSRGKGFELRVSTDFFNGRDTLHVRTWAFLDGEWRPTKSGVTVAPHELPEVLDALAEVLAQQSEQAPQAPPSAPPTPRPLPWRERADSDTRPAHGQIRRSNPVAPSAHPGAWSNYKKRNP